MTDVIDLDARRPLKDSYAMTTEEILEDFERWRRVHPSDHVFVPPPEDGSVDYENAGRAMYTFLINGIPITENTVRIMFESLIEADKESNDG